MPNSSDNTYPPHAAQALVLKEQGIEDAFIGKLLSLKYSYRPDIRDRTGLEKNFRAKFEALNRVRLTDAEFARLLDEIITPDVFTAAKTLRAMNSFVRDDGTPLNFTLVNIRDWCKNHYEIVHQLRINTDNSHHRYDVLILINGVPAAQIELKTLGISPRRAMEQIVEYKNDPGNGYTRTLLCFMQLFIVSNRTDTWYFTNNNARHFAFNADERFLPIYQFADESNKKITHLDSFAETFLVKCTLGLTISRYMVLIASEQKLLMMRPYQVYQVKSIVDCIHQDCGNGYIWSTTGSGKTLTSFKAATLLKDHPGIEKCLFVVDRKDLDRQTREEFNRFQEGCVEENTNTAALVRRLLSEDYADKVIVCTIQKLGLALDENSKRNQQRKKNDQPTYKELLAPLRNQRIVFIFDECHRSQFGENHKTIKEFFPKAQPKMHLFSPHQARSKHYRGVTQMVEHGIGRAFSPLGYTWSDFLGRCPRLISSRAFGPQKLTGDPSRRLVLYFRAKSVLPYKLHLFAPHPARSKHFRGVTQMVEHGIGRAFSPLGYTWSDFLGRCPRLILSRAFGPQRLTEDPSRRLVLFFRAQGAWSYQPGPTAWDCRHKPHEG